MSVSPSIQEFLRQADVGYTAFPHPRATRQRRKPLRRRCRSTIGRRSLRASRTGSPCKRSCRPTRDVDFERLARVIGAC